MTKLVGGTGRISQMRKNFEYSICKFYVLWDFKRDKNTEGSVNFLMIIEVIHTFRKCLNT